MKRSKNTNIKVEKKLSAANGDERDLTYYLHDRVELMHQVFNILKSKELKAMAPDCVRNLGVDDLQELCLEEVLGISSKRLCAILDGAQCPSDTITSSSESSSDVGADVAASGHRRHHKKEVHRHDEHLETISLDSISSDESIIESSARAEVKHKKVKGHKHGNSTKKVGKTEKKTTSTAKQRKVTDKPGQETKGLEKTKNNKKAAERAGMTVLELLELQARARAIRAQLALEKTVKIEDEDVESEEGSNDSDADQLESEGDVQIKEEPQEVVEIDSGSDDNKGNTSVNVATNNAQKEQLLKKSYAGREPPTLTVQMPKTSTDQMAVRKIKLVRNKVVVSTINAGAAPSNASSDTTKHYCRTNEQKTKLNKPGDGKSRPAAIASQRLIKKKSVKRNFRKRNQSGNGSDYDELIMEVSDGEKLDLFEESGEGSASEGASDDPRDDDVTVTESVLTVMDHDSSISDANDRVVDDGNAKIQKDKDIPSVNEKVSDLNLESNSVDQNDNCSANTSPGNPNRTEQSVSNAVENGSVLVPDNLVPEGEITEYEATDMSVQLKSATENEQTEQPKSTKETRNIEDFDGANRSDGELSDAPSSEVEMFEKPPEVLMISDEDTNNSSKRKKKKSKNKRTKEKKHRKRDKPEKKLDFREGSNQNYFEISEDGMNSPASNKTGQLEESTKQNQKEDEANNIDFEDVIEILEISDDSSSNEAVCKISKKVTTEDIIAFGIKIEKEIENEDRITKGDDSITKVDEDADTSVSWKERWLSSSKVKRVMTTSNILNALRKKNKELKRSLAFEKSQVPEDKSGTNESIPTPNEEGTVDLYNTLTGCNEYADVEDQAQQKDINEDAAQMGRGAKHLLKMYKRLLKANGLYTKEDKKKIRAEKKSLKLITQAEKSCSTSADAEAPIERVSEEKQQS